MPRMSAPVDFFELNRQFSIRTREWDAEEEAQYSYVANSSFSSFGRAGWEKLLEWEGVTIILGEPGSGKTYEFKKQHCSLRTKGETVFFIELQHLINSTLDQLLDPSEMKLLRKWRAGEGAAYFFLDAVDESKLRCPSDFQQALKSFRCSLDEKCLIRAHLFLSCRVHQWNPRTDLNRVYELLVPQKPFSNQEDNLQNEGAASRRVQVYVIAPLDAERVKCFARHRGVEVVESFIDALHRHHAWEFAGRPYDVDFLLWYWMKHRRLDSLTDMLEEMVGYQLKEREDKPHLSSKYPLSGERARQGAEALAAASVLCKILNFRIPDQPGLPEAGLLESDRCLPADWTPGERLAILDRPIFTIPCYGRIRFQHRRTSEYLAACWLKRMMKECTPQELYHLLFHKQRDNVVARQSRIPLAVWLACMSQDKWALELRNILLRAGPHHFFRFGDPSRLPVAFRREIIAAFVKRFAGRSVIRTELEHSTLSRLGDPDLAETLSEHLLSSSVSPSLKTELLQLAIYGRVKGCVPAALQLVTADTNRADLPSYALWLIRDNASAEQKVQLLETVRGMSVISGSECAAMCEILFPEFISASELSKLIKRVCNHGMQQDLRWHLKYQIKNLSVEYEETQLLRELLELLQLPPLKHPYPISERYCWLGDCIAHLLLRLLKKSSLSEQQTHLAARAIWLLHQDCCQADMSIFRKSEDEYSRSSLEVLSQLHPRVRQIAFWLAMMHKKPFVNDEEAVRWRGRIIFGQDLEFSASAADFDWMVEDVGARSSDCEREIVFHLACLVWATLGRNGKWLGRLQGAVKTMPKLKQKIKALSRERISQLIVGPWRYMRTKGLFRSSWWTHRWDSFRWGVLEWRGKIRLRMNIRLLRDGAAYGWLADLVSQAGVHSRWAASDWSVISKSYGKKITGAVQQGCVAVWKTYTPPIRLEGKYSHNAVIAGLSGLQWLFDQQNLHFDKMSHQDAFRATRYAFNEMNDFSDWFGDLVSAQPLSVRKALEERIALELRTPPNEKLFSPVLSRLAYKGQSAATLVQRQLREFISFEDPVNSDVLMSVLKILANGKVLTMEEWSALARSRIAAYPQGSISYMIWLMIWMQARTGDAIA